MTPRPDPRSFELLVAEIPILTDQATLVAIDGVDGAGKTTFAAGLATAVRASGRRAHVVHLDDFHRLRAARYRLGRDSPEGFFLDSYDYDSFRTLVLEPLARSGDGRIRAIATCLDEDRYVDAPYLATVPGDVVIVEGIFAHRDELFRSWDFSVFLEVSPATSVARLAERDGSPDDISAAELQRYLGGQALYLAACDPRSRASLVIAN